MENFIIIGIVAVIFAAAVIYIVRAKKKGQKCIGCPYGGNCSKNNASSGCCCGDSANE